MSVDTAAAQHGTASAAAMKVPAISRVRFLIRSLSSGPDSGYTITCRGRSRSKVVAAGLFEQAAPVGLHRHQVTEQCVIFVALFHRGHALQLGLDLGDLAADPYFLQP